MSQRHLALLMASLATLFYGLNHIIARDIICDSFPSSILVFTRIVGAATLFWVSSFFIPKESIGKKDFKRLVICSFLGGSLNMLSFFKGLGLSSPINSSLIVTGFPVIVAILSAIFVRERIGWLKSSGILISMIGALVLILFGQRSSGTSVDLPLGNFLILLNVFFFGGYFIAIKPLLKKYHIFHLMKWLLSMGALISFPFAFIEYESFDWGYATSLSVIAKTGYVILFTTYLTYLCNMYALRRLSPTTLSTFYYFQPMIVVLISAVLDMDLMTPARYIASTLIFLGVFMVSQKTRER